MSPRFAITPFLALACFGVLFAAAASLRAAPVYSHTFNGAPDAGLHGLPLEIGAGAWIASETARADGTDTAQSTAWIPYAFDSGVYTVTLTLDLSALPANNNGLIGIGFTNASSPRTGDFVHSTSSVHSAFGLRGTSDWAFWGGRGKLQPVDGGGPTFPRQNTLKLVLDTTRPNWMVTASLLDENGAEIRVDLSPDDPTSNAYTYETNPAPFTGVGVLLRSSAGRAVHFAFSAEPRPTSAPLR